MVPCLSNRHFSNFSCPKTSSFLQGHFSIRYVIFCLFLLDVNELKECLYVLVKEQQSLAKKTATTTLSALRLKQRLAILERYFIALNRSVLQENVKVKWKSSNIPVPAVDKKRY